MRQRRIIVITGTPGTGKTTLADKLSKKLKGSVVVNVNELVSRKRLFTGYAEDDAMIVKMHALSKAISAELKKNAKKDVILEGHLLCDMKIKGAVVFVLREHLHVLMKRLRRRGYPLRKLKDDIVSEATDYCGIKAMENYSTVFEFMCGKGSETLKRVIGTLEGKKLRKFKSIDMLSELEVLMGKPEWRAP